MKASRERINESAEWEHSICSRLRWKFCFQNEKVFPFLLMVDGQSALAEGWTDSFNLSNHENSLLSPCMNLYQVENHGFSRVSVTNPRWNTELNRTTYTFLRAGWNLLSILYFIFNIYKGTPSSFLDLLSAYYTNRYYTLVHSASEHYTYYKQVSNCQSHLSVDIQF